MNHCIKRLLFRYYALISITAFIVAILLFIKGILTWQQFAPIAAGAFGFAFAIQKQDLEETKLFKDLFKEFNDRYDRLDKDLNRIARDSPHEKLRDKPFTDDEKDTLFKYFNLCGEEYLYAEKGLIPPEVWGSWAKGMKVFRRNRRIKEFWDDDLRNGSYYGVSFDEDGRP